MTGNNGRGRPPVERPDAPRANGNGNFSPETIKRLARRSELFMLMTSGKGKPMTYGHGKAPGSKERD